MLAAQLTPRAEASECPDTVKTLNSLETLDKLKTLKKFFATSLTALMVTSFATAVAPNAVQACLCSEVSVPTIVPTDINAAAGYKWSLTADNTKEFTDAVSKAKAFCTEYLEKHPNERLAIVSDIDETVLDNRPCLKDWSKENWDIFFNWVEEAKAPKLKESADFLQWAREKGFAIFFVTGRHEKLRAATIVNLNKQGFNYDGLYLRVDGDNRPAEVYKPEVRASIEKMGFVIVENIGDQFSDLAGGHSADCQKLPNRMYFIK